MSTTDTMTPLLSAPWHAADGNPLSVRALPGLSTEVIQGLERSYPGVHSPAHKAFLETCSGLTGTELGHIDFTGCWFPKEPCAVFRPCLTLAIDDAGRRWIAEISDKDLPGPVWCIFPDPKVAVYVSDSLTAFIATLRECTRRDQILEWLQNLSTQAETVWTWRHSLARRPYQLHDSDKQVRGWLAGLPSNAYVYDLRNPTGARGWPYGLAGASGQLYRCGRLPVFAVAGSPSQGWYQKFSAAIPPTSPATKPRAEVINLVAALSNRRRLRVAPSTPMPEPGYPASVGDSRPPTLNERAA
jgi:hypothetical protein